MQGNGPLPSAPPAAPAAPSLAADLPRSLDIEIDPPIDFNAQRYTHLHLEEPTSDMVWRAEGELTGAVTMQQIRGYQIALVSHAAKVPTPVVKQMRISQMLEGYNFLLPFIGGGPPTGEN